MSRQSIEERAQALGPWWFRFEHNGISFGGEVPHETLRATAFFEWVDKLGLPIRSVLEMGAHEGQHTVQLASRPEIERVVALEGRAENIARAELVKELFGADKAEFHKTNLETFDPKRWGEFDAVFCSGLLYHLPKPWELVPKIAKTARRCVLIDTYYAEYPADDVGRWRGYRAEEPTGALAGFSAHSFLLSFKSLYELLLLNGLVPRFVLEYGPQGWHHRLLIFAVKDDCAWRYWQGPSVDRETAQHAAAVSREKHRYRGSPLRRLLWKPLPLPVKIVIKRVAVALRLVK